VARPFDLSQLTRAERGALAAGGLLFVNAFVPWWFRVDTPARTYFHNGGLTGWSLVASLAGLAAAAVILARGARDPRIESPLEAPVCMAAGTVALGALAVQVIVGEGSWVGLYVAFFFAVALVAAGFARAQERRAGWR
jgi:hypothetical protein